MHKGTFEVFPAIGILKFFCHCYCFRGKNICPSLTEGYFPMFIAHRLNSFLLLPTAEYQCFVSCVTAPLTRGCPQEEEFSFFCSILETGTQAAPLAATHSAVPTDPRWGLLREQLVE